MAKRKVKEARFGEIMESAEQALATSVARDLVGGETNAKFSFPKRSD